MVDSLAAADQVRLFEYLVPRIASAVLDGKPNQAGADNAWSDFRRVGERLAAMSRGPSITQAINDMRR